jgi:hypothetical protein
VVVGVSVRRRRERRVVVVEEERRVMFAWILVLFVYVCVCVNRGQWLDEYGDEDETHTHACVSGLDVLFVA